MTGKFKVSVVKYPDREHLVFRWRDPITDKWRCKSANTAKRKEAERAAGQLEREIMEGQHGAATQMNWVDFREYHERHCLAAMKHKSVSAYVAALNVYERFSKPQRPSDIRTAQITAWQTHLRAEGKSEATIETYTKHLRATLRWANKQGLLAIVPKFVMPKKPKGSKVMKGRPITAEEFERMLGSVPKVLGVAASPSWQHYLRGLWWSGLRLGESLRLRWDPEPGALVVDFSGRRPMFRIPAESDKGNQDRLLPMAPEFAEFLDTIPLNARVGRVFKPAGRTYADIQDQTDWASRVICQIGQKAGVVVDERQRRLVVDARRSKTKKRKAEQTDQLKRKFASAHDLRRAFGVRWAARVMPAVLQQLMRHEDIETTMRYYVGNEACAVADVLWAAIGNKSGNIGPISRQRGAKEKPQTLTGQAASAIGPTGFEPATF